MYAYCGNNPISRYDINGNAWKLALVTGTAFASWGSVSTMIMGALGAITPVGWVAVGVVTVVAITAVGIKHQAKKKDDTSQSGRQTDPIGRRKDYNTKKKAKEDAKKAGGGKDPIHHPKGYHGNKKSHYHPNVKRNSRQTPHGVSSHDHYYYPG